MRWFLKVSRVDKERPNTPVLSYPLLLLKLTPLLGPVPTRFWG